MLKGFLISIIMSFLMIGCYSTYKMSEYASKKEFYEEVNRQVKYKPVQVVLKDKSEITAPGGAVISGDSISLAVQVENQEQEININEIDSIGFFGESSLSPFVNIKLKNGRVLFGKNFQTLSDSSCTFTKLKIKYKNFSLRNVKYVMYKDNWRGVPLRMIIGAGMGFVSSVIIIRTFFYEKETGLSNEAQSRLITIPIASGALLGGVGGYFLGYNYFYEFDL
jgi:hypothetical protein